MAAKNKNIVITIDPSSIVGSEIMKNGDYKYARMGIKQGNDEYMIVTYEWKSETIPEFVMALMQWMQSSKEAEDQLDKFKEEYATLKERVVK